MVKDILMGTAYVLGGVIAGVLIWKVVNKGKSSRKSYDDILKESINKSKSLLYADEKSEEKIISNLLIIKRIREGEIAFCLIRRYDNGRTTSTVISPTFNIEMCPSDLHSELETKNEVVIQKIEC